MNVIKPCFQSIVGVSECTPSCTRWTSINEGQPILVYHDKSNWQPDYYPNVSDPNPDAYFVPAMQLLNMAYACGALFMEVATEAEANLVLRYVAEDPNDPCAAVGDALCTCDDDDDVCVNQFDHSQIFTINGTKARIRMYYVDCLRQSNSSISAIQWTNVIVHEFLHILGMGHVYGLPVESIMGIRSDGSNVLRMFDFDQGQLDLRYPCNCVLTQNAAPFKIFQGQFYNSRCPGCMAANYL